MPNPRETSIKAAQDTTRGLKRLFDHLGNREHPRGSILSIYRQTRRELRSNLNNPVRVADALSVMQFSISGVVRELFNFATDLGSTQATRELEAYELPIIQQYLSVEGFASSILSIANGQMSAIQSAVAAGIADPGLLIGDSERLGVLNPNPIVNDAAKWLALVAVLAWQKMIDASLTQAGAREDFQRQAIAAIDERTTDCCLRVHGQVVGLDRDFNLTGVPRFADKMRNPPFHWYCRTGTALVRKKDAEDKLTQQMKHASQLELQARKEAQIKIDEVKKELADLGVKPTIRLISSDTEQVKRLKLSLRELQARIEIHPAHARSRR